MPVTHKPALPTRTLSHARRLRGAATDAESALWYRLRARRLAGLKFRRQHPVPPYIVDFYCSDLRLVIELDGSQHTAEVDCERTRYLQSQGLTVVRFWDNDVLRRLDLVLAAIVQAASERTLTPTPLPVGEGQDGGKS